MNANYTICLSMVRLRNLAAFPCISVLTTLTDELSGSYPYRLVRKPIPKFALKMRVHRSDLWFDDEREQFKDTVAIYDPGVADIYLRRRWTIWMSRLFGYYKELYILAPSCGRPSNHYWNPGSDKTVSTSSASTTSLYNLNKDDTTPIVLFDTGSSGDLRTMSQRDLCKLLEDGTVSNIVSSLSS